ncbi:hypothetical protein cyc_03415 [Cyclospora cayetanensis]|uniref:Uncharacterized protein n=1 Tax=Cyclospora cayetanensis TaxID=88456 RepID=A0A1D3CWE5_9EIME|nr:hypothetical protein cyc_03415 [Cyclospora cayetanensis]
MLAQQRLWSYGFRESAVFQRQNIDDDDSWFFNVKDDDSPTEAEKTASQRDIDVRAAVSANSSMALSVEAWRRCGCA